jgi:hypothetical protein
MPQDACRLADQTNVQLVAHGGCTVLTEALAAGCKGNWEHTGQVNRTSQGDETDWQQRSIAQTTPLLPGSAA